MNILSQTQILLLSIAILLFIMSSSSSSSSPPSLSLSSLPSSSLSPSASPPPSSLLPSPPPLSLSQSPSSPSSLASSPSSSPPPSSLSSSPPPSSLLPSPPPSSLSPSQSPPSSLPPSSPPPISLLPSPSPSSLSPSSPPPSSSSLPTHSNQTNFEYIKTACNLTLYKTLCYMSLSPYVSNIDSNPQKLTVTALNITLFSDRSVAQFIKSVSQGGGLTPLEAIAVADCVEEIGNSITSLQDSMRELNSINSKDYAKFQMVMSDVKTWVSAALTNCDTCMDGFKQVNTIVKELVRQHVVEVARLTSNALALINMYASMQENLS